MALVVSTPNIILAGSTDKIGRMIIELKNALVASGFWRVRGSSDGVSNFQLMGQTAGVSGSYDVFTSSPGYSASSAYGGLTNKISNAGAWLVMEEIASGRCWIYRRVTGFAPGGDTAYTYATRRVCFAVATSGAAVQTEPAAVGTSRDYHAGNESNWCPGLTGTSTADIVLQIGVTNSLRGGNVAPFYVAAINKSTGVGAFGWIWESLTDAPSSEGHPFVTASYQWPYVFGTLGANTYGPESGNTTNGWFGGSSLLPVATDSLSHVGTGYPLGTGQYLPIDPDGKWRTERPWVRYVTAKTCAGRLEHYYRNAVSREYPATYNVSTSAARVACGHLIAPWAQGVAPTSNP